jgi:hypothetical protein
MTEFDGPDRDESGFALITVIGFVALITTLVMVAAAMADRSLSSSSAHVRYEGELAAAEDGIDRGLARAQLAYQQGGSDSWFTPGSATTFDASPECSGASVAWPFSATPSAAAERAWARTQLLAVANTSGCMRHAPQGDYVILKPTGHQAVYSMGWSPSFSTTAKYRLLKAEYIFAPYSPSNAILTGGDLTLDASTKVTSANQACPSTPPYVAGVHSNGSIAVSGTPTVCGEVSGSSDSGAASSSKFYDPANTGNSGKVTVAVRQSLPAATARQIWNINHATNPVGGWYDLCADGSVQSPTGSAPCVGGSVLSSSGSFRGWTWTAAPSGGVPTWHAGSGLMVSGYSGTYYAVGSDIVNDASNAGSAVPNLTVIAQAASLSCAKSGGNISWDHTDIVAPSLHSTFMAADQDLATSSNFYAGGMSGSTVVSGFFIAGDQISLQTSSNGAYGAIIAGDACDPADGTTLVDANIVKNPTVYYDPNAQAPFIDIINTTLWLEY